MRTNQSFRVSAGLTLVLNIRACLFIFSLFFLLFLGAFKMFSVGLMYQKCLGQCVLLCTPYGYACWEFIMHIAIIICYANHFKAFLGECISWIKVCLVKQHLTKYGSNKNSLHSLKRLFQPAVSILFLCSLL